jgi:plasmid stability protein
MATLNIRNVPESVRTSLRLRAARNGRSMEAEVRTILAEAVRGETGQPFDPASLQGFVSTLLKGNRQGSPTSSLRERRREGRKELRE